MKIQTTAHNVELTPEINSYLEKRLQTLEKLISTESVSLVINVVLGKESNHHQNGDIFSTEINMVVSGQHVYAKTEQESLYAAIDIAKDEVAHALRNQKTKKETLWRKGNRKVKAMLRGFKF